VSRRGETIRRLQADPRMIPELRQLIDQIPTGGRICVGCGCSDLAACPGPCHWTTEDDGDGRGLCSACARLPLDVLIERGRGIFAEIA
jgi:hypothetical protein